MKKTLLAINTSGRDVLWAADLRHASSHREAPMITGTPKLDGADFYMFNSYEAGRSNFVTVVARLSACSRMPYGGPNYFHTGNQRHLRSLKSIMLATAMSTSRFSFSSFTT